MKESGELEKDEHIHLVLVCNSRSSTKCSKRIEVDFSRLKLEHLIEDLKVSGWFLALASHPKDPPAAFAPICSPCAQKEMPDLYAEFQKEKEDRP